MTRKHPATQIEAAESSLAEPSSRESKSRLRINIQPLSTRSTHIDQSTARTFHVPQPLQCPEDFSNSCATFWQEAHPPESPRGIACTCLQWPWAGRSCIPRTSSV